ncbi:ribonucleotide-diphosphate reductase, subunit beta [Vibrio phage vB_VchM_Kuja]|uniref:ribonucleoside-diphosphate reductase n=1 Tax=Vibrio phage vB_VchM_Kuja TaxID=2686437 RepID=A0A6B9JAP3_9CAUD|nr:ribonucleoside diphosphate reductase small subunit [Vibrio phage vB_VchM_Kuja]QGZ16016.1 ribonucleotide-diphosphate reductase, subunit beta [Vibrio phage vB_VchM_Kuja]
MKHTEKLAWFDGSVEIQRYDVVRHDRIEKWNNKGLSFFWRPEEVDITKDKSDFESLPANEQHIFLSNLKRQILLDSIQGQAPSQIFGPLASTPENENAITNWTFQESIHSRSYTHIIRNVLADPSVVFDSVLENAQIVSLAEQINKYYDSLASYNSMMAIIHDPYVSDSVKEAVDKEYSLYEHKKAFWRALFAVNALEGVRFYVSFACSWAFMQMKEKMEGNAKIIKLICRDENMHLAYTQLHINKITQEDPDFVAIKKELELEMIMLFMDVVQQEKEWAEYLFKYGDMLGLNYEICCDYIDWIANARLNAIGYQYPLPSPSQNPLPWTNDWITSGHKQIALQEAENDAYLLGALGGSLTKARKVLADKYRYLIRSTATADKR